MALSTVSRSAPELVPADIAGAKAVSPVASATIPPNAAAGVTLPGLNLPLISSMAPEEAQRYSLNLLHTLGPAASFTSAPQAFPPPSHSSQSFQSKMSPSTPATVVKPTDVALSPALSAPAPAVASISAPPSSSNNNSNNNNTSETTSTPSLSASSAAKMAPVVAGVGTLPPNITPSAAVSAPSSSDTLGAIPTNKNNPAFLNKLRSMVDDPNTDELIRWSPDGASFFVPNHVRFGDDVLPRFFKHNRFSSFVRQLNMYGFHKVPHLQQGALKHDSPQESELWEFSNPHFHRDHPDWLSKVQRKKGPRDEKDGHGDREASASTGQELMHAGALMRTDFGPDGSGEAGALQLASVLNAINAIKNAQTSISADLRHLQDSNQNLWHEAVESRQRAKRQQETINKILRFLAGVFGNQQDAETPLPGKKVSAKGRGGGRRVAVRPGQQRSKSRLMIEDGTESRSCSSAATARGLQDLELPTDEQEIEEMPSHLRFQDASCADSPKSHSPTSGNSGGSRFTHIASPPSSSSMNDFSRQLSETVSMPGGSRRLSSQASNQVLNALASGEGNAWLASLFGASLANQGSKSTGPASGGGLKLDPQMVSALQQALASAGSGGAGGALNIGDNANDYFNGSSNTSNSSGSGGGGDDFSSRFSAFPSGNGSASNQQQGSNSSSSASGQALGLDADALARIADISQALVQSPSRQNASLANSSSGTNNHYSPVKGSNSGSLFDSHDDSNNNNQQLALSLSRATRDLQNTSNDVDQVQNSINSLLEGLQTNPNLLHNIAAQSSSAPVPWQNTDPNTAFGAGMLGNQPNSSYNDPSHSTHLSAGAGGTGATPPSTSAPAATAGMDSDFDVDQFLSQFVDSSQAPGGGVTSPTAGNAFGESPSFAFSPATTAAFLHGGVTDPNEPSGIYAHEIASSSGTSSSSTTPPSSAVGVRPVGGKKRKPSQSGGANGMVDVEIGVRPSKKSAARNK
ncbi:hypothetical protein NDA11_004844 [Ustilago hordei]|uniref:Related to Heat shock factor protein n=1 Tax=Ustilago hordei TaxID=120017 RepID=I2G0E9_USTHO|nr:uncharacterized protein UHO2_03559 [Ustilago hordei]KAJ1044239.1 hypothetical protein NDA10_007815 [Ustilago hordei]KAJ1579130.1 hypothetical protein NDA15_006595 [Ustilago hordei]KAJ1580651.1 hypothetical protein NDA12_003748 [Ustilago hordei]KAJ1581503.1 hypothetical protein NDA11_004844 [Ustilago hordei]CCF52642.1 related to Heat shock factor protein [Ustilago hordei]